MIRKATFLLAVGLLPLGGCKKIAQIIDLARHPVHAAPSPSPTQAPAEPGYTGVPVATPSPLSKSTPQATAKPAEPSAPAEPPADISTPEKVVLDKNDSENRQVKAEVLKRIDVMPNLKDDEKDKLYVQVERARGMGRVITIPFASGALTLQPKDVESIAKATHLPQIEKFAQDPTVVFVVLGYADKKGDPKMNIDISNKRADAVVKTLKQRAGVMNVIHAIGMGGSDIFDSSHREKNRVVEVWAVLP